MIEAPQNRPFWKNPVWLGFLAGIIYMYAVMLYFDYMEQLEREKIFVHLTTSGDPPSDDNENKDKETDTKTGTSRSTKRTRGKIVHTPIQT